MKNPFAQPAKLWELRFTLHQDAVPALEEAFAEEAVSTADFELDEAAGTRRATILLQEEVPKRDIAGRLALIEAMTGHKIVIEGVRQLEPKDWVDEVKRSFPPLHIGPFFIYGSHVTQTPPAGSTPLLVEANAAFGTGEHETTRGCLLALEAICRQRIPQNALDMGCGSAILAMAAAKRWHIPALGVEIDPVSVQVAQDNVKLNRLHNNVQIVLGDGYNCAELRRQKRLRADFRQHPGAAFGGNGTATGETSPRWRLCHSLRIADEAGEHGAARPAPTRADAGETPPAGGMVYAGAKEVEFSVILNLFQDPPRLLR